MTFICNYLIFLWDALRRDGLDWLGYLPYTQVVMGSNPIPSNLNSYSDTVCYQIVISENLNREGPTTSLSKSTINDSAKDLV
jgi:hypothetical protein